MCFGVVIIYSTNTAEKCNEIIPPSSQVVNTGVQTERGVHCTPSPALEHASTRQSASAAARVGGFSGGGNRLELSLATAVLSVAQRLGDVETRAAETVAKAEDAARDALQEVRREVR